MTQEHPITPPPELVKQWLSTYFSTTITGEVSDVELTIATQAARWGADQQLQLDAEQINQAWQKGADQELQACCEWLSPYGHTYEIGLRAARRPKPPSLKAQALEALDEEHADMRIQNYKLIRSVLESLPD